MRKGKAYLRIITQRNKLQSKWGIYVNHRKKMNNQEESSGNYRRVRKDFFFFFMQRKKIFLLQKALLLLANPPFPLLRIHEGPLKTANTFVGRCPKDFARETLRRSSRKIKHLFPPPRPESFFRQPTFLLHSIGDGFLDPSRPHDRRIRVGIIRHGHWNTATTLKGGSLLSVSVLSAKTSCSLQVPGPSALPLQASERSPRRCPAPSLPPAPSLSTPPPPRPPRPEQASWARNLSRFPLLGMATASGRGRPRRPGPRAMSWAGEPAPGAARQLRPAQRPSRTGVRSSREDCPASR